MIRFAGFSRRTTRFESSMTDTSAFACKQTLANMIKQRTRHIAANLAFRFRDCRLNAYCLALPQSERLRPPYLRDRQGLALANLRVF